MRSLYLRKSESCRGYYSLKEHETINIDLKYLRWACEEIHEWIAVDEDEPNIISIWCYWDIKDSPLSWVTKPKIRTDLEWQQFCAYRQKRASEIPALNISKQNYEQVLSDWKKLKKEKPNFIVFTIDDHGIVTVVSKQELDDSDWSIIKADHEKYLNFIKKQNAHFATHPRSTNTKWMSTADNEFFSDYLTEDEMVWKQTHKLYK